MASLRELEKRDVNARIAAARRRAQSQALERTLVHKGTLITSAALYGTLNRMNVPIAVAGFPWKLGVGALALLGEGLSRGNMQAVMSGVADATMAIYVERSITTDTLIAGEHDDYDDDDDDDDDEGGEV